MLHMYQGTELQKVSDFKEKEANPELIVVFNSLLLVIGKTDGKSVETQKPYTVQSVTAVGPPGSSRACRTFTKMNPT